QCSFSFQPLVMPASNRRQKVMLKHQLTVIRLESPMLACLRTFLFCNLLAAAATADDWPQWLGPMRDDVWKETGIVEKFPEGGPKILWRVPLAGGYSGPAVAAGKVYVTDFVRTTGDGKNDPMAPPE